MSEASTSVWRAAHLDGLIGLANRRLFMERLNNDLEHARENAKGLAVLFIDLDDFKIINDRLGHDEQCNIGACVGLALFPEDADEMHEILSKADSAMYEAKRAGKSSWRRYVEGLSGNVERKRA